MNPSALLSRAMVLSRVVRHLSPYTEFNTQHSPSTLNVALDVSLSFWVSLKPDLSLGETVEGQEKGDLVTAGTKGD